MEEKKTYLSTISDIVLKLLSSRKFLVITICFFVLQAIWVAISFRYPTVFDESFHMTMIDFFSQRTSPVVTQQPAIYDAGGNIPYGNTSFYHYLLSFPYRFLSIVSSSYMVQVIVLRLLNIFFVALGLYIFTKIIKHLGLPRMYASLAIFVYALIPITSLVAATVSYDNLIFLITAYFILCGLKILKSTQVSSRDHSVFLLIGIFGALIKFTFLPVLVVGIVGLLWLRLRTIKYRIYIKELLKDSRKLNKRVSVVILISFSVLFILFLARYAVPVLKFHTPIPDCSLVLTEQRCNQSKMYEFINNLVDSKNTRQQQNPAIYTIQWAQDNLRQLETSGSPTASLGPINIKTIPSDVKWGQSYTTLLLLLFFIFSIGIFSLIYSWQTIRKGATWTYSLLIILAVLVSTFSFNMMSYYSANIDLNTQVRYLLSVFPLVIALLIFAVSRLLGKLRWAKIIILGILLIGFTQGGGIIKHIISSDQTWYWPESPVSDINRTIDPFLTRYVDENVSL